MRETLDGMPTKTPVKKPVKKPALDAKAAAASPHRVAHLGVHMTLQRPDSMDEYRDALDKIDERADDLDHQGLVTFLCSDNNDHDKLWKPRGFKRLGGKGIDWIGVRIPKSIPVKQRPSVKVLEKREANGTIDKHNFYGVKVRVTWADGFSAEFWVVQGNLGRGETTAVFVANATRIKNRFPGAAIVSLDEIDEADGPDEHEELGKVFDAVTDQLAGWGTMSPTIVRSRRLVLVRPRLTELGRAVSIASGGVPKVSPTRPLVESQIAVVR